MHSRAGRTARAGSTRRAAVIVALAATLVACTAEGGADTSAPPSTASPTTSVVPAPTVPPTTTPPSTAIDRGQVPSEELSFGEYQQAVAAADQAAYATLETLAGSGSFGALRDQAAQGATTIGEAAGRLDDIVPPESLSGQHAALAAGLGEFASGLEDLAARVASQELCAAPALLAELNTLAATGKIRAATHAFAAAGGGRVTFLPNLTPPRPQRPGNGQHLRPQETEGAGELVVDNGGIGRDVVITMQRGNTVMLSFYVRGNSSHKVTGIGDAGYTIYFSHGTDWSQRHRAFSRDCDFNKVDDVFRYETSVTEDANFITTHYTEYTLGLRERVGGNLSTTEITPEEFPQ